MYFLFLICFIFFSNISGEDTAPPTGFQKESLYLEFLKGRSLYTSGSYFDNLVQNNRNIFPVFPTEEAAFIYQTRLWDYNKPSITSKGDQFLFEYAITKKIGFGLSIRDYILEVKKYNSSNLFSSLFFANYNNQIVPGQEELALSAINLYYLVVKENYKIMATYHESLHFSYHFRPEKKWDPYLRFHFGTGRSTANTTAGVVSLSVGSRFFFHPNFYLVGDMEATQVSVRSSSFNPFIKSPPSGSLNFVNVNFGIGLSPWDITGHTPYPKRRIKRETPMPDVKEMIYFLEFPPEEKEEYKRLITELEELKDKIKVEVTLKRGKLAIILLQDAFFSSGEDELFLSGIRSIKELTNVLKKTEHIKYRIDGHTDNVQIQRPKTLDRFKDNQALSFSRALQVFEIMRKEGFPVEKVLIHGLGDTDPRASNDTESGRMQNRRIEILADRDLTAHPDITELIK
jgi:flagellar motor protein MotB